MISTQAITRGTCILAETPLIEFSIARRDQFYEDAFWGAGKFSGAAQVNEAVAKLNDADRRVYNALKRHKKTAVVLQRQSDPDGHPLTTAQWDCLNRAQTNAFKRDYEDSNGVDRVVFTVFDHISLFNHACRPNAIYQWDDELDNGISGHGQGVIHALHPIQQGDEITLCYVSLLDFVLKSRDDRRTELNETWKLQCACAACSDTTQDPQRQTAWELYQALDDVAPPSSRISGDTYNRSNQLQKHKRIDKEIKDMMQLATNLKALGVTDTRLADA